jgi:hypothetical protein
LLVEGIGGLLWPIGGRSGSVGVSRTLSGSTSGSSSPSELSCTGPAPGEPLWGYCSARFRLSVLRRQDGGVLASREVSSRTSLWTVHIALRRAIGL